MEVESNEFRRRVNSEPSSPPERSPEIIIEEWNGSSSTKLTKTATITSSSITSLSVKRSGGRFDRVWNRVLDAFVPEGFPGSVTPDYVPFQVWDSLQGLSTYIRMMLSTQALLSAIGVGEKSATVIGATFQWFLRDLTGMVGGILFTFYQGSNLDSNAKMWRLVADLMNDLGMLMDLVSPLFPSAFIFVVCLGSLSRSFTGVASGATRAALTQHFALQNNAADISAKEGSQETVATMIGMALGMLLARVTAGYPMVIWISFLALTFFHMYANYRAVQCLALNSLNIERISILLQNFLETGQGNGYTLMMQMINDHVVGSLFSDYSSLYSLKWVLSPEQVSKMEHVLPLWISSLCSQDTKLPHTRIALGVRVSSLDQQKMMELLHSSRLRSEKGKYLLVETTQTISIVIHKSSTASDVLQSFIHALVMLKFSGRSTSAFSESQSWIDAEYENFLAKLHSSGWKTGRLLSSSIIWRANWMCGSSDGKNE